MHKEADVSLALKTLLDEKGITVYRLAKDIGISQPAIHAWIHGSYEPKPKHLKLLADYFDIPVVQLIDGEKGKMDKPIYGRISALCKANGTNISEFERFLGFARGSICKIDEHQPSANKIQRIADYLHTSVEFLLYGSEMDKRLERHNELKEELLTLIESVLLIVDELFDDEESNPGCDDPKLAFKSEVKKQMALRKWTYKDLSEHTPYTHRSLAQMMYDREHKLSEGAMREIAKALDIQIE